MAAWILTVLAWYFGTYLLTSAIMSYWRKRK